MKGICFKEPLFMATVKGNNTQTRRIMNPQPEDCTEHHKNFTGAAWANDKMDLQPDNVSFLYKDTWDGKSFCCRLCGNGTNYKTGGSYIKSRYKFGETLYLKEPYYLVDDKYCQYQYEPTFFLKDCVEPSWKWKNKLFMPASAARYFIRINAVRIERLQDITEEDCFKEGIIGKKFTNTGHVVFGLDRGYNIFEELGETPIKAYAALIDKINGKGTWESNPFVFVYDYELVKH